MERESIGRVDMVPEITVERGLRSEEDTRVLKEGRRRHCFWFWMLIPSIILLWNGRIDRINGDISLIPNISRIFVNLNSFRRENDPVKFF